MRVLYGEPRRGGRLNDSEAGQRTGYLRAVRAGLDLPLILPGTGDDYPQGSYFPIQYNKTAQVLAALRAVLGPEVFHRAFVQYGRRWVGRHPQPYDFFNSIATASQRDLSWFWSTWFYHAWSLDQALESVSTAGDSVTIAISDRGMAPMPVRLVVTRADSSVQRLELPADAWLGAGGGRRAMVRVASKPSVVRVAIDPEGAFPDVNPDNQTWSASP
jgi:hypothetical protein